MQRLSFHARHLDAVLSGAKRITMRFQDPVSVGPALLVFELPEPVVSKGHIVATVGRKVHEVTDDEARADGFAGREAVLPALREYYPQLHSDDDIVIVSFELG
jgi:hypothetical protein